MKEYRFIAVLLKHPRLDSAYFELPFDPEKEYGKKRVKVKATIDGTPYRGSLVRMGMPCWWLGVTQEIRKKIGKNPGDTVQVILSEDAEERTVEVPADLQQLFGSSPEAEARFGKLSFTNRKEYVRWIVEAKREETRRTRLEKTIALLLNGKKNPSDK